MTRALSRVGFAAVVHGRAIPRARVAGLSVPLASIVGAPRSAQVGSDPTATLTATDIANLDAQVNTQNSAFIASDGGATIALWAAKWAAFLADWKAWFSAHGAGTGLGGDPWDFANDAGLKAEFDGYVGQFNELLREWTAPAAQGGLALSTPATPAVIPELDSSWLSKILGTLGTIGTVALVVGIGIGGLELYRVLEDKRKG